MKKRFIWIFAFVGIIVVLPYLQYGRDVEVTSSIIDSSDNFYEQDLTIIANRLFIWNKEKFSREIIERCIDNNFHEARFSYDIKGYPNRLQITVYPNSFCQKITQNHFTILYETTTGFEHTYNIKDNPEEFKICISE